MEVLKVLKTIIPNASELVERGVKGYAASSNTVQDAVNSALAEQVVQTLSKITPREKVVVNVALSFEEEDLLRQSFGDLDIKFNSGNVSDHGFAMAHRHLETHDILRSLGAARVKDIGGNWFSHAIHERTNVHSCCPILGARDDSRQAERLFNMYKNGLNVDDVNKCDNVGQKCKVKAEALMFIHSVYDMKVSEVADCMDSANALIGRGTIMFHPDIFVKDKGTIPALGANFVKDKRNDQITFRFVGGSSWSYTHKYSKYIDFIKKSVLISKKNNYYYKEIEKQMNGVLFFKITKSVTRDVPSSKLCSSMSTVLSEYKVIKYYDLILDGGAIGGGFESCMRKVTVVVPRSFYDKVLIHASNLPDGSFTLSKLHQAARSFATRTIERASVISDAYSITPEDLMIVTSAAYVVAYRKRFAASKVVKILTDDELRVRGEIDQWTFFTGIVDGVKGFMRFFNCCMDNRVTYKYPIEVADGPEFFDLAEYVKKHDGDFDDSDVCVVQPRSGVKARVKELIAGYTAVPVDGSDSESESDVSDEGAEMIVCECKEDLQRKIVPADGDCFFHCVAELVSKPMDVVKEKVQQEGQRRGIAVDIGNRDYYPVVSDLFKIQLCVHEYLSKDVLRCGDGDLKHVLYVPSDDGVGHYDLLMPVKKIDTAGTLINFKVNANKVPAPKPPVITRKVCAEQYMVWEETTRYVRNACEGFFTKWQIQRNLGNRIRKKSARALGKDGNFGVIRLQGDKFTVLHGKLATDTKFCYHIESKSFMAIRDAKEGYSVFCDDTKIFLCEEYMKICKNLRMRDDIVYELIEGVPGSGKTTTLISHVRAGDVVVAATSATKDLITKRLAEKNVAGVMVRTAASLCAHGMQVKDCAITSAERMHFDECLMVHAGFIEYCALLVGAKSVYLYGDRHQIPYIERNNELRNLVVRSDISELKPTVKERLTVSHRCPQDVVTLLRAHYGVISTTSAVEKSMQFKTIVNEMSLKGTRHDVYLTFTQFEKEEVSAAIGRSNNVYTINEYQGEQAKDVVLVRLRRFENSVYNCPKQRCVAISRHTEKFTYYSVIGDELTRLIHASHKRRGGGKVWSVPRPVVGNEYVRGLMAALGEGDVESGKPVDENVPIYSVQSKLLPSHIVCESDPLLLQTAYDSVYNTPRTFYDDLDNEMVEYTPISVTLPGVSQSESHRPFMPRWYDYMRPVMQTHCPAVRPASQVQTRLALAKRNLQVPELKTSVNTIREVQELVDAWERTYVDDLDLYRRCREETLTYSSEVLNRWLKTQPPGTDGKLVDEELHWGDTKLDTYQFMIKRTPKVDVNDKAEEMYKALQTIAYKEKCINAIFCPIFKMVKERMIGVLKKTFLINTDMNDDELTERLQDLYHLKNLYHIEIDIGKYDKSQTELSLMFEAAMMERFGVSEELIDLWIEMHRATSLVDKDNKVHVDVEYQRKSGDAATFIGNTCKLMGVVAKIFPNLKGGLFAGDDSVLWATMPFPDRSLDFATMYNLECKTIYKRGIYFCSKYLVDLGNAWILVPDPMKILVKLGRKDLRNPAHLHQFWVSLVDRVKIFDHNVFCSDLMSSMRERHPINFGDVELFVGVLVATIRDEQVFKSMYLDEGNLCYDTSLPTED